MLLDKLLPVRGDRRGVAAVEFALWSSLIFSVLLVSADFAIFTFYKARLKRAVSAASLAAYNGKDDVDAEMIAKYVTATAAIPGVTPEVSVTCNGGTSCADIDGLCGCISLPDGHFTPTGACSDTCPSQGVAGTYLTISARAVYHHVVIPNPWLEGQAMTATAVVRL